MCPGRGIYFVREGRVSLTKNDEQKMTYTKGDVFGKDIRRAGKHTLEFEEDTTCGFLPAHAMQTKLKSSMKVFNLNSRSVIIGSINQDIKSVRSFLTETFKIVFNLRSIFNQSYGMFDCAV